MQQQHTFGCENTGLFHPSTTLHCRAEKNSLKVFFHLVALKRQTLVFLCMLLVPYCMNWKEKSNGVRVIPSPKHWRMPTTFVVAPKKNLTCGVTSFPLSARIVKISFSKVSSIEMLFYEISFSKSARGSSSSLQVILCSCTVATKCTLLDLDRGAFFFKGWDDLISAFLCWPRMELSCMLQLKQEGWLQSSSQCADSQEDTGLKCWAIFFVIFRLYGNSLSNNITRIRDWTWVNTFWECDCIFVKAFTNIIQP